MSDELMRCTNCGAFDPSKIITYKITEEFTAEELQLIETALGRTVDTEMAEKCSECGEVADVFMYSSTEDDRL